MWRWILLTSLLLIPSINSSSVNNYYCGEENCYEILGIAREATKNDIRKAFRGLALKHHPDKVIDPEAKKEADVHFKKLTNAYDILRDEEFRSDYDYMLDHPDQFYMNYYRAWRRRNYPNVDVRLVIAVLITLISGVQYYNGWSKYNEAISYFSSTPKYRNKAMEIAREQGLLGTNAADKRKNRSKSKQQLKEQEDTIIRDIIQDKMDIRGVYAKPTMYDVLWVQLAMMPIWFCQSAKWQIDWLWRFTILKQEFGDEQKLYLIRRKMALSRGQWEAMEDHEHKSFLKQELWKDDKFKEWKACKDEELRVKQATNSKMKMYRRYLKNNGPGRMYFDDS